ncbi:MAG TPA: hypothetical protein VGC76_13010 [Pyrinomonadaceae bacterium]|jgi:hypothetical protein
MENLAFQRILIVIVTLLAMLIAAYAYVSLKLPYNAFVIAVCVGVIVAVSYFATRREKAARLDIFYSAANEFGRPVSFDNYSASFERNGTQFDCEFPQGEDNTTLTVSFYIPNVRHKFIIEHGGLFRKNLAGCGDVKSEFVSEDFHVQGEADDFLENFLKNKKITGELYDYPKSIMTAFWIVFDDGNFELQWAPPVSEQIDGFYQICRTAVVFHDELKKFSEPGRR